MSLLPLLRVAALGAVVSGCASMPAQNDLATVQVRKVYGADRPGLGLKPAEVAALRSAGLTDEELRSGRVVSVDCAVMSDGWWESLVILPPGVQAREGATLRVRVLDPGNNDRPAVSAFVAWPAQLPKGGQAYRFVPNWRELGRRSNLERVELPPELRDKYLIVQSTYMLKCSTDR